MAVSRRTGLPAARLEARSDVTILPEDEQALATRFGIRSNLDRDMHQFLVLAEKPPDGLGGTMGSSVTRPTITANFSRPTRQTCRSTISGAIGQLASSAIA